MACTAITRRASVPARSRDGDASALRSLIRTAHTVASLVCRILRLGMPPSLLCGPWFELRCFCSTTLGTRPKANTGTAVALLTLWGRSISALPLPRVCHSGECNATCLSFQSASDLRSSWSDQDQRDSKSSRCARQEGFEPRSGRFWRPTGTTYALPYVLRVNMRRNRRLRSAGFADTLPSMTPGLSAWEV